jgi:citrate lyase subunit beta/citryl-CoA lyase/(S)-citramalyl-CoA lyase
MEDPQRCLLFVPGSRPERFEKAFSAGADMVCIDLEDAVVMDQKDEARRNVLAFLTQRPPTKQKLVVRINPLDTEWGARDASTFSSVVNRPDFVMLPKVRTAADLERAGDALGAGQRLIALLECPQSVLNADAIAAGSGALDYLMFGGADFSVEMGCDMSWNALLAARGYLAMVAAKHGKGLIDVPFLDVGDSSGLQAEARLVQSMGFTAKSAIHPSQVLAIQAIFTPSEEAAAKAKKIIVAFENSGSEGAILVDGRLVDKPVVLAARKTLAAFGAASAR